MIFRDRIDGGDQLAKVLEQYKNLENGLIIGLPRGGVPVAYQVSESLNLPLDIVCPRKIGAPHNPEFAIGAITETGEGIFNHHVIAQLGVSEEYIKNEVEAQKQEAQKRLNAYRKGRSVRELKGKTIIIVDDGLATGSTMKAAIQSIKAEGAKRIIVAVPVSPTDTATEIKSMVDEFICLCTPASFYAVGQFYENFSQTTDEEVIELLRVSL